MYLTKETYIGANYAHNEIGGTLDLTREGNTIPIQFNRVVSVDERLAYWRKAYQIHKWFVNNVQEGLDDNARHYVTLEQLKELVELCKQVAQNPSLADELLPTDDDEQYNEWYFMDIHDTIAMLEPVIEEIENSKGADIYYQSSW